MLRRLRQSQRAAAATIAAILIITLIVGAAAYYYYTFSAPLSQPISLPGIETPVWSQSDWEITKLTQSEVENVHKCEVSYLS